MTRCSFGALKLPCVLLNKRSVISARKVQRMGNSLCFSKNALKTEKDTAACDNEEAIETARRASLTLEHFLRTDFAFYKENWNDAFDDLQCVIRNTVGMTTYATGNAVDISRDATGGAVDISRDLNDMVDMKTATSLRMLTPRMLTPTETSRILCKIWKYRHILESTRAWISFCQRSLQLVRRYSDAVDDYIVSTLFEFDKYPLWIFRDLLPDRVLGSRVKTVLDHLKGPEEDLIYARALSKMDHVDLAFFNLSRRRFLSSKFDGDQPLPTDATSLLKLIVNENVLNYKLPLVLNHGLAMTEQPELAEEEEVECTLRLIQLQNIKRQCVSPLDVLVEQVETFVYMYYPLTHKEKNLLWRILAETPRLCRQVHNLEFMILDHWHAVWDTLKTSLESESSAQGVLSTGRMLLQNPSRLVLNYLFDCDPDQYNDLTAEKCGICRSSPQSLDNTVCYRHSFWLEGPVFSISDRND